MKRLFLLLAAVVLVQGCATEFSSTEYSVNITSNPPGKNFQVVNKKGQYVHQGKTPEIVMLNSQSDFFDKEEYTVKMGGQERKLQATLTPLYYFNIVIFPGFVVDGLTGAMWALPDNVNLDEPQTKDKPGF